MQRRNFFCNRFHYLRENHNSVLGMREYCREHGGAFKAVTEEQASSPGTALSTSFLPVFSLFSSCTFTF